MHFDSIFAVGMCNKLPGKVPEGHSADWTAISRLPNSAVRRFTDQQTDWINWRHAGQIV